MKRKTEYFLVGSFENNEGKLKLVVKVTETKGYNKIWDYAYTVNKWNTQSPWICRSCKFKLQTFEDFTQKPKDSYETSQNLLTLNKLPLVNEGNEIISVLFQSQDYKINYSIPCNTNDIFSEVINELFNIFPEYKNRKCCFLQNGEEIYLEQILKENKIKSGLPIIVIFLEEQN